MSCCCDDPSCSHSVLADAIREASNLTDIERVTILRVLGRDELLRREQEVKVMHLKAELQNLRRKGALRPSTDLDRTGPDPDRCCGRCRVELGRVINRGAYCRACRLKVCKGCREYSYRTTDWVCTVCHKRMEIQAASGEWMNEFVRRPSRRRDNRVYVPAADIIKRTIRRSWTISNPSTRWNAPRATPEMRLYNSLPRGQDINSYPSLKQHQESDPQKTTSSTLDPPSSPPRRHSPARRTHSEDVYPERSDAADSSAKSPTPPSQRSPRINPLILYAQKDRATRAGRKKRGEAAKEEGKGEGVEAGKVEKRVSFESCARDLEEMPPKSPKNINPHLSKASSLTDTPSRIPRPSPHHHLQTARSLQERWEGSLGEENLNNQSGNSASSLETSSSGGTGAEREFLPVELCDIEPLSGTVFRKVTVRRRRQDMRKMAAVDSGRRRCESDSSDALFPDRDEYRLVFISSDSSSKEEDPDDNDSSSSFPIEECDWDYFEPRALTWGSPRSSRKEDRERAESPECEHREARQCRSCGGATQFIPIPVPVPIPVPIPTMWTAQEAIKFLASQPGCEQALARLRVFPRNLWPLLNAWPLLETAPSQFADPESASSPRQSVAPNADTKTDVVVMDEDVAEPPELPDGEITGYLDSENRPEDSSSETDDSEYEDAARKNRVARVYNVNGGEGESDADDALPTSCDDEDASATSSSTTSCSSDSDDTGTDQKSRRFSKVFVVNAADPEDLDSAVILRKVKPIPEEEEVGDGRSSSSPSTVRAPGVSVALERTEESGGAVRNAARYTSLVMITQEPTSYQKVSVVTSNTTRYAAPDVVVKHTNWQDLEVDRREEEDEGRADQPQHSENVTVITGAETLSAFEEGLADDDSWVENISHDEDDFGPSSITEDSSSGEEVTLTCSVAVDNEDELRGYHRAAIDFTLHTIVEESCEESEVEQSCTMKKQRPASATDLEKYFFFGLGDGNVPSLNANREDAFSETSSVYSEGLDSLGGLEEQQQNDHSDPAELASSRLEKYFLSGFMGFNSERRDSDGSVGSDSEGRPSPEQRRKRLVRARGTGRSHSSSLDNLLSNPELSGNDQPNEASNDSENSSSSDSDTYDETTTFEKSDGQFDTVKRKKNKKKGSEDLKSLETTQEVNESNNSEEDEEGHKTPQPENATTNLVTNKNQQSRDSGFIGSCDDLLKEQRDSGNNEGINKNELRKELENIMEEKKEDRLLQHSIPPATALTRKDSFNNWSSDEETNLMMCKMRQFFKTMIANSQCASSKPTTPNLSNRTSPIFPSPRLRNRCKPPQLVYFENELTRLMKTVPGIRDDQVREIVEYLSSEDTWSDSYDSSDYTSSDLEGTTNKSALQQQISDSCKLIINKFDNLEDEEGDEGDGGENLGVNKETSFVYQKLVASFEKMASGDNDQGAKSPNSSPTLIARVMHHIGSRLVALMHEVSSGESHASNSPKARHYHRRLQQKLSNASSTTTDDDSTSDTNLKDTLSALEDNFTYSVLSRSKSHDLLMGETKSSNQTGSGDIIVEEREASDCERFSWRGSFESALLATDSRNRLSIIGSEGSASASALAIAAKRRSAGDLIFSHKSLSREQLDRVRSCGSIGGASSEDKLWVSTATRPNRRRSSVPDASCGSGGSADGEEDDEEEDVGSSLPRNLQTGVGTTNSLPRLPTNTPPSGMHKAQSHHFLPQNAKSARYRPPGFNRPNTTVPKRAVSAPGLQPSHQRRGRRSQQNVPSETTKRLIKPNSQDGLTEADLYVFEREFESECSDESTKKQNFVTSFDIDDPPPLRAESEEFLREEKLDLEDEISVLTDDTNASVADGSAKKKKKKKRILNILKLGKTKRKTKDGISVTSSATSLTSEFSDGHVEDLKVASTILEKTELSPDEERENDDVVPPPRSELAKEKGSFLSRSLLSIFPNIRGKKGKKNENQVDRSDANEASNVPKVIPLGFGPPKTDEPPERDLEVNLQMKPFWRTFSKKYKKKTKGEEEAKRRDLVVGSDALKVFGPASTNAEAQNAEPKKKTLLETLKLTKKDERSQKEDQKDKQIPCILSACVNSDIKPEEARRNSSDSVEVKTIAEVDLENDGNTIRIVKNEFFPSEVHASNDTPGVGDAGLEVNDEDTEVLDTDQKVLEFAEKIERLITEEKENLENSKESLESAKKYQVFDKEDFSESLHTLVDEEDKDHVLLAPSSALTEIPLPQKTGEDDSASPEGIFRSSCRLSIHDSQLNHDPEFLGKEEATEPTLESNEGVLQDLEEKLLEPQPEEVVDSKITILQVENIVSSSETITKTNLLVVETSSEVIQNPDAPSESTSWVEVSNMEDLNDSQFNNIYKATLEAVQNAGEGGKRAEGNKEDPFPLKPEEPRDEGAKKDPSLPKPDELRDEGVKEDPSPPKPDEPRDEGDKEDPSPPKPDEPRDEVDASGGCEVCGKSVDEDQDSKDKPGETKCVCTTLTKPRQSLTEIEEGSVKSKVEALNKSKQPIIVPLSPVEFAKKDDVTISEAHSSPTLGSKSKSATPSPIAAKSRSGTLSSTNSEWQNPEEDMDRIIQGRGSLSGLGLRSDSMASVYSGAGEGRYGTVAVRGQVEFGLQYNYKAGALEIHVKQCKDLAPVDTKRNRSDPYVKVYLLPDKSKGGKRKTKVKKHTLNPVFDETLKFHISLNGLETRTLWLTVWHSDMFGRNDFLGEVMMALENKVFDDPSPVWYNLQERTEPFDDTISFKGDIIVCLKFVPPDMTVQKKGKRSRGTLHVLVKEAKYLTAYKANGTSDPFCKSYLLPDKGRNSKQKTPVVKKTVNPVWNHTFIYEDVTLQELAERCLELTVWDHDRLASNEFLGGVRFSLGTGKHYGKPVEWMDATGKELTLWKSMLERPNFWVEGCLSLRPSLDARTS